MIPAYPSRRRVCVHLSTQAHEVRRAPQHAAMRLESASWPQGALPNCSSDLRRRRIHTGAPWRDLPEEHGTWITVYQRFRRCSEAGIWEAVATTLCPGDGRQKSYSFMSFYFCVLSREYPQALSSSI